MFHYSAQYSFRVFFQYDFFGIVIGDPITACSNLLLFFIGLWCYRRVRKINTNVSPELAAGLHGWELFFRISAFAYLVGVPVHGFSYYMHPDFHFWLWVTMGWIQMIGVACVQIGTAKQYFPKQVSWIRALVLLQFIFFCTLMVWIKKFGAVNTDISIGLIPIAAWNIYLYAKGKVKSYLVGAGILFAGIPAIVVGLKWMPTSWMSYNDVAHFLLIVSLLVICRGVEKNVQMN